MKKVLVAFILLQLGFTMKFVITVDDVPNVHFKKMVNFMEKKQYFVIWFFTEFNQSFDSNATLIDRVVSNENFMIGNHTKSHDYNLMKKGWYHTIEKNMLSVHSHFERIGYRITLFRAPYGMISNEGLRAILRLKYKIVIWHVELPDEIKLAHTSTRIQKDELKAYMEWHAPRDRELCVLLLHPNIYTITNLQVIFEVIEDNWGIATVRDYVTHGSEITK
jgi:peptidoglycan/xylan/chitin deacetylase (PgdA/CDA1 family)